MKLTPLLPGLQLWAKQARQSTLHKPMGPTTSWPPMPIDDHQQCHLQTFRVSYITLYNPCISQGLSKPKTLEDICLKIPCFTIVFLIFFSESGCMHISFKCKMPSFHVKSIHTQRLYTFNGDFGVTGPQLHSHLPPPSLPFSCLPLSEEPSIRPVSPIDDFSDKLQSWLDWRRDLFTFLPKQAFPRISLEHTQYSL